MISGMTDMAFHFIAGEVLVLLSVTLRVPPTKLE
jgi:hypothetical protein